MSSGDDLGQTDSFEANRSSMSMCWFLVILAGAVALGGCDLVSFTQEAPEETVPPKEQIREHIDTFVQEADERGIDVTVSVDSINRTSVDRLEIRIREKVNRNGKEYCGFVPVVDNQYTDTVYFATRESCWGDVSKWARETLVFHELGHAVLDRLHKDERLPNGMPASIMFGKTGFGYRLYEEATIHYRKYYVDELFDSATPVPDWSEE